MARELKCSSVGKPTGAAVRYYVYYNMKQRIGKANDLKTNMEIPSL